MTTDCITSATQPHDVTCWRCAPPISPAWWDRLSVGTCLRCRAGASLIDGLCYECRPAPARKEG